MTPTDPLQSTPAVRPGLSSPVPDDEDIATDLVEIGRRVADWELRDAVTEHYVDEANAGEETDEADADLAEEIGPESDGIYGEVPPED